jgi:hypothetical protein
VSDPQTAAGEPVQQPGPPIGAVIVLAVAIVFYLGMMACLGSIQSLGEDAVGRAMAEGFSIMFAMMLWVVLGILLLIGGIQGAMPGWSAGAAAILLVISGVVVVNTAGLLDRGANAGYLEVPAVIPLVFAGYAMWARLPSWRRAVPALPTSIAAWVAVALLIAAPMPHFIADYRAQLFVINQERAEAEAAAAKAEAQRRATADRFHKLTMELGGVFRQGQRIRRGGDRRRQQAAASSSRCRGGAAPRHGLSAGGIPAAQCHRDPSLLCRRQRFPDQRRSGSPCARQ